MRYLKRRSRLRSGVIGEQRAGARAGGQAVIAHHVARVDRAGRDMGGDFGMVLAEVTAALHQREHVNGLKVED